MKDIEFRKSNGAHIEEIFEKIKENAEKITFWEAAVFHVGEKRIKIDKECGTIRASGFDLWKVVRANYYEGIVSISCPNRFKEIALALAKIVRNAAKEGKVPYKKTTIELTSN